MKPRRITPTTFAATAAYVTDNGYRAIPIDADDRKKPDERIGNWREYEFEKGDAEKFDGGTGILCGVVRAVDIDVRNESVAAEIEVAAIRNLGKAPHRIGNAPKSIFLYRTDAPGPKITGASWELPGDSPDDKAHKVEVLGDGQQFVAFGKHRDTGKAYRWSGEGSPLTVPVDQLPLVTDAQLRAFVKTADAILAKHGKPRGRVIQLNFDPNAQRPSKATSQLVASNYPEFLEAFALIPNRNDARDPWWIRNGQAFYNGCGARATSDRRSFKAWDEWSRQWSGYDRAKTKAAWTSFGRHDGRAASERVGAATIYALAKAAGWKPKGDGSDHLLISRLSDIEVEVIIPLWPGRFYLGKTSIIAGNMGLGKSTLAFDIAARITVGAEWPDGSGHAPQGEVLILSTEDGAADTIRPRIEMMDGDVTKVHVIQGVESIDPATNRSSRKLFSLTAHMDLLRNTLASMKGLIKLVIIDPITGVFHGTDTHKTADVREVMGALKEVCEDAHSAFIGISHPNKAQGQAAMYRITGSLAFAAAPRSAFIVGTNPDHEEQCVLAELKNNLGPRQPSLGFQIVGKMHKVAGSVPVVEWLGEVEGRPDDILDPQSRSRERGREETTEASVNWLRHILKDGPVPTKQLAEWARNDGFSDRMIRAASEAAGARKKKTGFGKDSKWVIYLPDEGKP